MAGRTASKGKRATPSQELAELRRGLSGGTLANGYLLTGDESYFTDQALGMILPVARDAGLEVSRHDASDTTRGSFLLQMLIDDLTSRPMFAPARLILVRGAEKVLKKEGRTDSPASRAMQAFLTHGDGTLVVCGKGVRADHAVAKAIVAGGGSSVNCRKLFADPPPWNPDPRSSELCLWLVSRARELKIKLGDEQAVLLLEAVGADMFQLETELEKLRVGGAEALNSLNFGGAGAPWKIADQLLDGKFGEASKGLRALFSGGFRKADGRREVSQAALAAILLGGLAKGVRSSQAVLRARGKGLDATSCLAALGLATTPAATKRLVERASTRPPAKWNRMAADVLELERRTRSGTPVDEADFQRLVLAWR